MRHAAILLAAATLFGMTSDIDAQRGRNNPFAEFQKKADLAVGQPAPRLHLEDTAGNEINLRDYLGRWVFIEFGSYT
jgi:cytochrome oxidase Cu insertion factor (SCO1/SenC/PrrC family)